MAGSWPSRPEKLVPTACSGCSPRRSGTPRACVTTCVSTSWNTSDKKPPLWSLMKAVSPNAARSRQGSRSSTVEPPGKSRTVKSASFLLISGIRKIPTYHLICGFDARSFAVFKNSEGQFHILAYVTARGHGLIDRELYLPEDWCDDPARRLAAHIPQSVTFQTKPELARRMVERAQSAGLPIDWVVADTDLRSLPRPARLPRSARLRLRLGCAFHR